LAVSTKEEGAEPDIYAGIPYYPSSSKHNVSLYYSSVIQINSAILPSLKTVFYHIQARILHG